MTIYLAASEMISVVIPVLNEARVLETTLERLAANPYPREVIVVDGGSTDRSVEIARAAGARVIKSDRSQRAAQMNLGAAQARGGAVVFLHADTELSPTALQAVALTLQDDHVVGGGFYRRFGSRLPALKLTCRMADWRNRLIGWHLGDQAIFARRKVFQEMGGYRDIDLFEDLDFSRRLARHGRVVTLRPAVVSSARRFERRGAWRTTMSDFWLTARYYFGADPNRLAADLRAARA
ncbi:MAG TPA: TIGR04283 family arsenosugar biosynthesis glycosyltransferase [Verrucomicrobiae bacterium]|nr:TIGR04283 family arsenosugar biosynthesis glycosyltransferase [Verrucomicrobiae bacterium]